MGPRQVPHMNVIANAEPVRGGEVVTEHGQRSPARQGRLDGKGDQMGFRMVRLPDQTLGVRT